jgi:hypothetical protein
VVVDRARPDDRREQPGLLGTALGDQLHHPLDRGHDGVGSERGAVVEGDVVAEVELPRRRRQAAGQPGGEVRDESTVGVTREQGLVDVVVDRPLAAVVDEVRVEARRFGPDRDRDRRARHRACRVDAGRGRLGRGAHCRAGAVRRASGRQRHDRDDADERCTRA